MRTHAIVALLVAAVPAFSEAQSVQLAYAPGTVKYQVTSQTHVTQEVMGQKTELESTSDQKLTFAATAKAGGQLDFTLSLDTLSLTSSMGMIPDVSKIIGTKFSGVMATTGKVVSGDVTSPAGGDAKSPQANGVKNFMPVLTTTLTVGGQWTDTTNAIVTQGNGSEVKTVTVANFTLVGDTAYDGQSAWKVQHATTTTLSGKGNMQGQDFSVEGTSKGAGMSYFSKAGVYLGRGATEETNITVTVESQGLVIPVTQSSTSKVTMIK